MPICVKIHYKVSAMSIQINPNNLSRPFTQNSDTPLTAKVLTHQERQKLLEAKPEVSIEGDLFTYGGVDFKKLSKEELQNEKIDTKKLNLTQSFTTQESNDKRLVIAFRDPQNPSEVIAYKLDKEIVAELQKNFSKEDFFQRDDGILRLSGAAEEYIAGWVLDIKQNRGYEEADANGDGVISADEKGDVKVGFTQKSDYSYLANEVVSAKTRLEATYTKLSELDANDQTQALYAKGTLHFQNSVEKELAHTLKLDKDKDGTLTLKEALEEFTPPETDAATTFLAQVQTDHNAWIKKLRLQLDTNILQTRELFPEELEETKEKEEEAKSSF